MAAPDVEPAARQLEDCADVLTRLAYCMSERGGLAIADLDGADHPLNQLTTLDVIEMAEEAANDAKILRRRYARP